MRNSALACVLAILATTAASAALPPDRMNYQGVLRDAAGDPIDGNFDMVFRFFDAETLGGEILVDRYLTVNGQAVQVAGGLFSVELGGGELLDGAGPGTYANLAEVFAAHGAVWLEIQVGAETLAPRLPVHASAYALNAGMIDGRPASEFLDSTAVEQAKPGKLIVGANSNTGLAHGLEAYGSDAAGYFENTVASGVGRIGYGDIGVFGLGMGSGGSFVQSGGSGAALIAVNDHGIQAYGSTMGGYFANSSGTSRAELGFGGYGVQGYGAVGGGYFEDQDGGAFVIAAQGGRGIRAHGDNDGGFFSSGGSARAYLASGDYGVDADGNVMGGHFSDRDNTGIAYLGYGDYGVYARGSSHGGYFADLNSSGYARVGYGDYGVQGYGTQMGALFDDTNGSGFAYLAFGEWGAYGYGNSGGFTGSDLNNGTVGYLATGTSSTQGNGSKNFVQNHPYRDDQVILYAAPEGNEVATYTRGTARLVKGEARIALDETFAWVTNPDIGLTVHLTPVGGPAELYVLDKSTSEVVVRGDGDVVFDYMVWGLRVGFEEVNVVEPKGERDAWIPSMQEHRASQQADPSLRKHVALERFKAMDAAVGKGAGVDLSRATALRDAIGVFDPAVQRVGPRVEDDVVSDAEAARREPQPVVATAATAAPVETTETTVPARGPEPARVPLIAPVAAGDLIVMDESGALRAAFGEADPGVVGIAAEDSVTLDGTPRVTLVSHGIARLKVDADLGAIRRGDPLISSPTPGHAMRAYASIPGTVIAKALEPLASGQGTIRVLVTPR